MKGNIGKIFTANLRAFYLIFPLTPFKEAERPS